MNLFETERSQDNRTRHAIGLSAGVLAIVLFFVIPGGVGGYLALIVIGVVAVVIGHGAVGRRGPFRWMALVGLVLSYLELILGVGLLLVRLTRMLTS